LSGVLAILFGEVKDTAAFDFGKEAVTGKK
jgi:hypothetical protein